MENNKILAKANNFKNLLLEKKYNDLKTEIENFENDLKSLIAIESNGNTTTAGRASKIQKYFNSLKKENLRFFTNQFENEKMGLCDSFFFASLVKNDYIGINLKIAENETKRYPNIKQLLNDNIFTDRNAMKIEISYNEIKNAMKIEKALKNDAVKIYNVDKSTFLLFDIKFLDMFLLCLNFKNNDIITLYFYNKNKIIYTKNQSGSVGGIMPLYQ